MESSPLDPPSKIKVNDGFEDDGFEVRGRMSSRQDAMVVRRASRNDGFEVRGRMSSR